MRKSSGSETRCVTGPKSSTSCSELHLNATTELIPVELRDAFAAEGGK